MLQATAFAEPHIETSRLVLRPASSDDIDALVEEISDIAVAGMLARVPCPYRRSDAEAFLDSVAACGGSDLPLTIALDDRLIGGIGLSDIRRDCEFGYWLGQAHWGRGYATEAGRAFLAYAFDTYDTDAIKSGVFFDNPASLKVQGKLGFEQTGTSMRHSLARGRTVEHIDTILTRARFESLQP